MLRLLGSFSMVFQIPSSYSAVAILFLKKEIIRNFCFISYSSFWLYSLQLSIHINHTLASFSTHFQASFALNKLLSENNAEMTTVVLALKRMSLSTGGKRTVS